MRDVRRKQRLESVNQHQEKVKATIQQSHDTVSGMTARHSTDPCSNDWSIGDNEDPEWFSILFETRSMLESLTLGPLASGLGVENAGECDDYGQSPDYGQSYDADNASAFRPFMFGTAFTGSPRSLIGDGILDPFNALPVPCGASYNGHVLQHCMCHLRSTFPFGQRCMGPGLSDY